MYKTFNTYCREVFGCKVYKLSLDGGFTCPNRDGTLGTRGCIFCSARGSGDFAPESCLPIPEQLVSAKARVEKKCKGGKYMAYFQAFTNTYAPVGRLRQVFTEALEPEEVVGLSVATRPDCLPPEVLSLLKELNRKKPVLVELGLQTIHEASIRYIRRGYENAVYVQAVKDLKALGIPVVTHIILGLPGESEEQMVASTQAAVAAGTHGVKFHLLHVLSGTDLERDFQAGKFSCLTLEDYARVLKKCLGVLPPEVVVHRITGDGAKKDLVAPLWSADKKRVLNYLTKVLQEP